MNFKQLQDEHALRFTYRGKSKKIKAFTILWFLSILFMSISTLAFCTLPLITMLLVGN